MALALGPNTQGWGLNGGGGFTWYGQGPAPQMTDQQKMQSMGFMSSFNPQQVMSNANRAAAGGGGRTVAAQPMPASGAMWQGRPAPQTGSLGALSAADQAALNQLTAAGLNQQQIQQLYQRNLTASPTTQPGSPQYGLSGAQDALQRGLEGGLAGLEAGVNQATGTLSPYTQGGGAAYQLQAALSGALGPQAQAQAFANYQQSPEQQYLREQSEKAILRNASATGGLGSSNVLTALQRNATGLAAQDYANAFNRLGSLSGMGLGASGQLAGIQAGAGGQAGQMAYGTGGQLANYRTRAGEQIAGNVQGTSQGLAGMINQQGNDLSSLIGAQGTNIANLLSGYGQADAQTLQSLAALLANIRTGSASQVSGLPNLPQAGTGGILEGLGNLLGGVGSFASSPANPWG